MGCDTREQLAGAPPSAKLVFLTLQYEGELTQNQLTDETRLSARTVRYALTELKDREVIEEGIYFADARKRLYSIAAADESTTSGE